MTTLRNIGAMERNDTNPKKSLGIEGVSRFVFEGVEYCCGVNATVCVNDRCATAWLAFDSRMQFVGRS